MPTTINGITIPDNPQNGAWYSGRQYWNGTLSDPGVINTQSNQVGAGQAVSPTVIAASNPAQGLKPGTNEAYLDAQRKKTGTSTSLPGGTGAFQPTTIPSTSTGSGGTTGPVVTPQPAINLPQMYQDMLASSGINQKNAEIMQREQQYLAARNKISDNPFLDASTIDNRLQRLKGIYEEETSPLRNDIATRKADIETQMALQTKQFDINSELAKQALTQFTTLLSAGALDNISGEDVANLTRMTGLGSNLIQSAIESHKLEGLTTEIKSFDDGENEGFAIYTIDKNGNVVNQNKQITGTSTKAKSQYSSDPAVSSFIATLLKETGSTETAGSIDSLWE